MSMKKVGNFFYIVFFILLLVLTYLGDTHQTIGRQLIYDIHSHSYHYEYRLVRTRR
jgi:hypothetical protein